MGLRQMLHKEGMIIGLHEGIESLLSAKFGEEGQKLMARIRTIQDPAKLKEITVAIGMMDNGNLHDLQKQIDI